MVDTIEKKKPIPAIRRKDLEKLEFDIRKEFTNRFDKLSEKLVHLQNTVTIFITLPTHNLTDEEMFDIIIDVICKSTGIYDVKQTGNRRSNRDIARTRHLITYFTLLYTNKSIGWIAGFLNVVHSSIIINKNNFQNYLYTNTKEMEDVKRIKAIIDNKIKEKNKEKNI